MAQAALYGRVYAFDALQVSVGSSVGMEHARGGMGASGHLDADSINLEELERQGQQVDAIQDMEAPEGAIRWERRWVVAW